MDADLVAETERLQTIYRERGLQLFQYACLDGADTTQGGRASSPLFRPASPDGTHQFRPDGKYVGNLIEIIGPLPRCEPLHAWTDEWTTAIRADERIPWTIGKLHPEQLPAFAEWQQTFRDFFRLHGLVSSEQAQSF